MGSVSATNSGAATYVSNANQRKNTPIRQVDKSKSTTVAKKSQNVDVDALYENLDWSKFTLAKNETPTDPPKQVDAETVTPKPKQEVAKKYATADFGTLTFNQGSREGAKAYNNFGWLTSGNREFS